MRLKKFGMLNSAAIAAAVVLRSKLSLCQQYFLYLIMKGYS